jgi:crossover junction endodeoxyribonuclease RuvC
MKKTVWIGIDPGQGGALAALRGNESIPLLFDWPGDEMQAAEIVRDLVISYYVRLCALEMVGSFSPAGRKQGGVSMFKFGTNFGIWRGILAALQIPFVMVRPQEWQKGVVPKKAEGDDKPSLAVARRMFPDAELHLKKHHGRADALLLAHYAKVKA